MNIVDKKKLLTNMKQRLTALEDRNQRDFGGGLHTEVGQIRELNIWISKLERGEFDTIIWSDDE
jgi:hypothetical protein